MEEEMLKMVYGLDMIEKGVETALNNNLKGIEIHKENKEYKKEIKKEYKKDAPFIFARNIADTKLGFIKWSLMFGDYKQVKEALPLLIKEIRNIADELESIK